MNRYSAIAVVLLSATCADGAEKNLDRTFTVAPGGSLIVEADSASVQVSGADSNQVTIHMRAKGADKDLADTKLEAVQSGNAVTVTLRRPKSDGWFNWRSWSTEESIEVTVPRRYLVSVRTGGGSVELSDTTGTATLKTSGGEIIAKRVTGNIELRTSGGEIEADTIRGDVDADTSGGDVRLLRIDGKIKANTSGGGVRVSLVGANREISATTSGGDIELIVPRATTGNVDASTSGGEVTADLPILAAVRKDGRLEGTLNGGGPTIYAHTSGGSISLRPEN